MIKGTIYRGDRTLIEICTPNQVAPKYIKQLPSELRAQTEKNTVIAGDL